VRNELQSVNEQRELFSERGGRLGPSRIRLKPLLTISTATKRRSHSNSQGLFIRSRQKWYAYYV